MTQALNGIARQDAEPRRRRPLLALAVALSAGAHFGVAAALWVEHAPQPEAGAVVAIEIVPDAGAAGPSTASAAASGRSRAAEDARKPAAAPAPKAISPPTPPRQASEPPTHSPPPAEEAPPTKAPAAVEETPSAVTALRRPSQVPPAPAHTPRLLPPPPARAAAPERPARPQTAANPIVAADVAPGAMAPGAGPEPGTTAPRYGFGSAANPIPRYPETARARGWEGVVLLSVSVAADGRAESVNVARGSGHAVLDQAALEAVRRWRFEPARRAGMPVPGTAAVPIRFRLED